MTTLLNSLTVFAAEVGGAPAAGGPSGAPSGLQAIWSILPFVLILGAFFWMMSRSQKKRERARKEMLDAIRPKDDVMTIGGIRGRVMQIKEEEIVLRIDPDKDIRITMAKSAISRRLGDEPQE